MARTSVRWIIRNWYSYQYCGSLIMLWNGMRATGRVTTNATTRWIKMNKIGMIESFSAVEFVTISLNFFILFAALISASDLSFSTVGVSFLNSMLQQLGSSSIWTFDDSIGITTVVEWTLAIVSNIWKKNSTNYNKLALQFFSKNKGVKINIEKSNYIPNKNWFLDPILFIII